MYNLASQRVFTPIRKLARKLILFPLSAGLSAGAYGWDAQAFQAKVKTIEVSYLPSYFMMQIDKAAGSCAAGSWLTFSAPLQSATASKEAAVRSVLAATLAAQVTATSVNIYLTQAGCSIMHIHLGNQ
jgi:hypothetical protein